MATIETQEEKTNISSTFEPNRGKALTTLDHIGAFARGSGAVSGEDALSVLNRKLESSGVLGSGSSNPVFANETALIYLNTTTNKVFIRGTTSYDEINAAQDGANFIGHDTTDKDRSTASDSDPWIYVNTNNNKVWIKVRTGSPGSYSYTWSGPIYEGTYRTLVIYNGRDVPPDDVVVTWNWQTDTLGFTGSGWTENQGSAKWCKIIVAPRNSNNAIASANIPVGGIGFADNVIIGVGRTTPTWNAAHTSAYPLIFWNTATAELFLKTRSDYRQVTLSAGDIGYDPPSTGNFPQSVDTVQDALDWLHTAVLGGGNGGTDDQTASEVATTTANFGQNVPRTANNVQLALNALNLLAIQPFYEERFPHTNNRLESRTAQYTQNFTIPQRVIDFATRWEIPLFIIAESNYAVDETTVNNVFVELTYEVLRSGGTALTPPIQMTGHRLNAPPAGSGLIRSKLVIKGVLPSGFTGGQLRTSVTDISAVPPSAGVEFDTIQVWPDPSAIDSSGFSGNLSTATNTLQKLANAIDMMAMIGGRYEQRAVFTGGSVTSSTTPTNLGTINISSNLRDEAALELGYPIRISVGAQINGAIASGVEGRLYISNGTGINDTDYGGVNLSSSNADNSVIQLNAILPPDDETPTSTNVPSTIYVMLRRDSGASAIAVDNGVVFLERDQTNQILDNHLDRYDFNSGDRFAEELIRIDPSTSAYTINVPQSLLDVRTNESRAIRVTVRANLQYQSAGTTNIDFQIRNTEWNGFNSRSRCRSINA